MNVIIIKNFLSPPSYTRFQKESFEMLGRYFMRTMCSLKLNLLLVIEQVFLHNEPTIKV